jgi:hypothetical protein
MDRAGSVVGWAVPTPGDFAKSSFGSGLGAYGITITFVQSAQFTIPGKILVDGTFGRLDCDQFSPNFPPMNESVHGVHG